MNAASARVVDLLWHNIQQFPDRTGLRIDGEPRSWRELGARVRDIASFLRLHYRRGDRVGLWLHNCPAWIETFLALDEIGVVSVPINTRLTGTELGVIMRAAQLQGLVTTDHYRGRRYAQEACAALGDAPRSLRVFEAHDTLAPAHWIEHRPGTGTDSDRPQATPDGVFCIQYTSGTTSIPKGVMLTDAAYLQTASYVARCQRLTPSSEFISAGPFFHCSGSMHALSVSMLAGCTLNSMSVWDPVRFLDDVSLRRCTVAHMIYFRDVLALGDPRARDKLRSLEVAHDLGTPDFLMRIADELGVAGISNIYGMTETAGQFTMWFPDDPIAWRTGGNGRPQPGNHIRIVDPETGCAQAPGMTGEIQMRGPTISPGYFANDEARRQAFTDDGWFRSGDLGRIGEHGELVYVARLKEMIRVGGENLAPAEVEQALRDLTGATLVCALGMPDPRLDEVVAAVLVTPRMHDWPLLMKQLRERLAGFKLPRALYLADELPITATNRVQRATLKHWIEAGRLQRVV